MIKANSTVKIQGNGRGFYDGHTAKVIEVRSFRTALVEMVNGKRFVMSTGDMELVA